MPTRRRLLLLLLAVLVAAVGFFSRPAAVRGDDDAQIIAPTDRDTCLGCHGEVVDGAVFGKSAHGALDCQLCHAGVDRFPHPEKAIAKMPTCVTCHKGKASGLAKSVHARFGTSASDNARCAACHGAKVHAIAPMSKLTPPQQEAATCAKCHGSERAALAKSVHGGVRATGSGPNCFTCHGDAHQVTPPAAVLGKTDTHCWQCHGEQAKMLSGSAHGISTDGTQRLDCLACHGGTPHGVRLPGTRASLPDASCRGCHTDIAQRLAGSAHGHIGAKTGKKTGCLSCHGDQPHAIKVTQGMTTLAKSAVCESCHADRAQQLVASAHGKARLENGQHLNCLTCHGSDQHGVIPSAQLPPLAKTAACLACHAGEGKTLAASVHGSGPGAPGCADCHPADPKQIAAIGPKERTAIEDNCRRCHSGLSKTLKDDVHARPDKVPGDHPTCLSCHGTGHKIQEHAKLTPKQKVEICAKCHEDAPRMKRYGVLPDTVEAYATTFHGRAILRLNRTKEATCVDCHGLHGILDSSNPQAPTHPQHVAAICRKCHEGGTKDFAFPYASHFRLGVEKSVVNPLDRAFSKVLVGGIIFALFGLMLAGTGARAGRPWVRAGYNALILLAGTTLCMLLGTVIIMVRLGMPGYAPHAWSAGVLLLLTVVAQVLKRRLPPRE